MTTQFPPRLVAVVAMTADRVIGRDGTLPWHLPDDLAFFRRTTTGHPIVMGRKTYDSIGRPLPKRRNIVLTRDPDWTEENVEVIHRPEDLFHLHDLRDTVYIIGGSEIYNAFLDLIDEVLVSHVFEPHAGDTKFPEFESRFPEARVVETHPEFEVRRHLRKRE